VLNLRLKLHILRLEEFLHLLLLLCCILDSGCLENQLELLLVDRGFQAKLVSLSIENFQEANRVQPGEEHGFDAARRGLQVDGVDGALNFEYPGRDFLRRKPSPAPLYYRWPVPVLAISAALSRS